MSEFREFSCAGLKRCSGWFDALIQNKAMVDFATNAPGYGQLQNDTVLQKMNQAYYGPGGCKEQEEACYAAGDSEASNEICRKADHFCVRFNVNRHRDTFKKNCFKGEYVFKPAIGDRDADDLRQNSSALFPSSSYVDFLSQTDIQKKIGAEVQYQDFSDPSYNLFIKTGDVCFCLLYLFKVSLQRLEIQDGRTWLPQLGVLANSGIKILIWVRACKIMLRILPLPFIGW